MPTPGCICEQIKACMRNKCAQITISGLYSGVEIGDCDCCTAYNSSFRFVNYSPEATGVNCDPGDCFDGVFGAFGTGPACDCFATDGGSRAGFLFATTCGTGPAAIEGQIYLSFNGYYYPQFAFRIDDHVTAREAIKSLCGGSSITLPLATSPDRTQDDPFSKKCYASEDATMTVALVDGDDCHTSPEPISFECMAGKCVRLYDSSGPYETLTDCIDSPCSTPVPSYSCVQGVCTDPQDGSGLYISLDDCVAAGCSAPSCGSLDGCTPTLIVEIHGLSDCFDGGENTYSLSNLNGVYSLAFDSTSAGIYFFKGTLNPTPDDRASYGPSELYLTSVIGTTTIETYVYAIEAHLSCSNGEVTITEWQWKLESFSSDSGGPWSFAGNGSVSYTSPTDTLPASVTGCIAGYMLSLFDYTNCNSATAHVRISGNLT